MSEKQPYEKPYGIHTIYGVDKEHETPYMTRMWLGRLRFHIFHRGDADPDCHDHPWDFWTFPLTSYVEEVLHPVIAKAVANHDSILRVSGPAAATRYQVVKAFRPHFRKAEHAHRVLGRYSGRAFPLSDPRAITNGKILTIVWRGRDRLFGKWGFIKFDGRNWCKDHWRKYIFHGGKHAACEPVHPDQRGDAA